MNNPNTTTIGMDANLAVLLSYIINIIAIVVLITEKENKFVKFHSLQALLFHLSAIPFILIAFILFFAFSIIGTVIASALGNGGAIVAIICYFIGIIIWFAAIILVPLTIVGGSIYAAIQAYHGKWLKLPVVGNLSMKILGLQN